MTAVPFPPEFTVCGVVPVIVPFAPALYVRVKVSIAKFAITVQFAVTALVVNTLPARLPPQVPPTLAM